MDILYEQQVKDITWSVSEGQSVDDHLSLYGEEKSASIWTPTARLIKI